EGATEMKSKFLANMSHEIRTPMNSVLGYAQLLLSTELNNHQKEYVDNIQSSGDLLLNIINNILDYLKIESQKMLLEEIPVEIVSMIEKCLAIIASKALDKEISLFYDISPNCPDKILGDPTKINQILLNITNNAVKFTKQVNSKNVNKNKSPTKYYELLFTVADTGIGIPEEKMDKLFKPFSQVDTSTKRKFGGTGLGLAICKDLTELMGGSIKVEGGKKRKGTKFSFTIKVLGIATAEPVEKQFKVKALDMVQFNNKENNEGKKNNKKVSRDLSGLTVLVADDNNINQNLLKRMLSTFFKIKADTANNGLDVLNILKNKKYDLIFMDYRMPEMDG
ncbi:hypothetical protein BCR32DRAFT_177804, partial [Anaeromyces robustus]